MMYIRDLAAIVGLTMVVAGSFPMTAGPNGKTHPCTRYQTGNGTDPVVRKSAGHMLNNGATQQTRVCSVVCDPTSADHAGIDSAFI